jgi:uncharacterized protein (DUF427 family)
MTLTVGSGPFGQAPAGEFNLEIPSERILLFEPFPRRMRASFVRDPYHRVDVLPSSRHVVVRLGDEVLAESRRARVIYETALPPRWDFPAEDVVAELSPTKLETVCAYKGFASYWSVKTGDEAHENITWTYREPLHAAAAVADHIAFFNERVEIEIDGEIEPPVQTPWSAPNWWKRTLEEEAEL